LNNPAGGRQSQPQTTRPQVHFALLPGLSAPHGASCDESIQRCRVGGCGMTYKKSMKPQPTGAPSCRSLRLNRQVCGNLGTPLARSSDLLFPVVRLRESKWAVLLSIARPSNRRIDPGMNRASPTRGKLVITQDTLRGNDPKYYLPQIDHLKNPARTFSIA
jgi:hypothetical protein